MNRSFKYALVFAGFACATAELAAEESHSNSIRLDQLVYTRPDTLDAGERFTNLLENQPTAAGPQQAEAQPAAAAQPRSTGRPLPDEVEDRQR